MTVGDPGLREELKRRYFKTCDVDRDGYLNKNELRVFASHVGFSGTDEEWDGEYQKICAETKADHLVGVPQAVVMRLLEDQSGTGCYCTDEEMMVILGIEADFLPGKHGRVRSKSPERGSLGSATEEEGAEDDWEMRRGDDTEDGVGSSASSRSTGSTASGEDEDKEEEEDDMTSVAMSEDTASPDEEVLPKAPDSRCVLFAGADIGMDESALYKLFQRAGCVKDLVLYRRADGCSRGMGLARFSSASEALRAASVLSGMATEGTRALTVVVSGGVAAAAPAAVGRRVDVEEARIQQELGPGGAGRLADAPARIVGGGPPGLDAPLGDAQRQLAPRSHRRVTFGGRELITYVSSEPCDVFGDVQHDGAGASCSSRSPCGGGGDGKTINFSGVPAETTASQLLNIFRSAGPVETFRLFTTPEGLSSGTGIVRYQTPEDARRAAASLRDLLACGREMVVSIDGVEVAGRPEPAFEAEKGLAEHGGARSGDRSERACDSTRLFFSGAPVELTEGRVRALFEEYGPVESLTLFRLQGGNSHEGMGICTFATLSASRSALMGGLRVNGCEISLQEDVAAPPRPTPPAAQAQRASSWRRGVHRFSPYAGCQDPHAASSKPPPPGPAWGLAHEAWGQRAAAWHPRQHRFAPYSKQAGPVDPRKAIFFSQAPFEASEAELFEHFEEVGRVRRLRLFRTEDGRSRGMGTVEYMNAAPAWRAYYNMNGLVFKGRPLVVTEYRP